MRCCELVKGSCLYATVLVYPEDGVVRIKSLKEHSSHFHAIIKNIDVLGFAEKPAWERNDEALTIRTKTVNSPAPVVFKFEID